MTDQYITEKQEEILTLIYKYKFLNRIQIQALLKHKDHRRINSWLKDLYQKEYIKRIWSDSYFGRMKPAIYYLAPGSLGYLGKRNYVTTKYFQKIDLIVERSDSSITDSLLLADIGWSFLSKHKEGAALTVLTQTDLNGYNSRYAFFTEAKIKPNLLLIKQAGRKSMTKYYTLEIIDKYLSKIAIRNKIKKYFELYNSNAWEDNVDGKFPTVLFVCPSLFYLIYTKRYVRRIRSEEYEDTKITFQFTLLEKIISAGVDGEIWEKA